MKMYELILSNNKIVVLNERKFTFLKLINQLGFLNRDQLTLLWSVVNKSYKSFSYSVLRRWLVQYHLLEKHISPQKYLSDLSRPVYYVSSTGINLLKKYHVDYIPLDYLQFNSHNEQCNEVTIQTLFRAAFSYDLNNNLNLQLRNNDMKQLITSPFFELSQLDLRPFSMQVNNYKAYPLIPDQIISFNQGNNRCEIMIELDNRTENNTVQLQKIANYIYYAKKNPNKRILLAIAITDGSLTNRKNKRFKPVYQKINNLLSKFKRSVVNNNVLLEDLYLETRNLMITVSGVSEAHIDLADFILNTDLISPSIYSMKSLAILLTQKTKKQIIFKQNDSLPKTNYFTTQGQLLGQMFDSDNHNSHIKLFLGFEHSLDTYIYLHKASQRHYSFIYVYPMRAEKLLTPAIVNSSILAYQMVLGANYNVSLIFQMLYIKKQYSNYLYHFFKFGKISASDISDYSHLTYLHPHNIPYINQFLKGTRLEINGESTRSYKQLHDLALKITSSQEFSNQLNIQDIPLEVVCNIFKQLPIKAFKFPFTSSPLPDNQLEVFFPNKINPEKRTKFAFYPNK